MGFLIYLLIGLLVLIYELVSSWIAYGAPTYDEHLLSGWFEKNPKMYRIMVGTIVILLWPIEVISQLLIIAYYIYDKLRSK